MHEKLIALIAQNINFNDEDIVLCKQYFEAVSFPKNTLIEKEGSTPKYLYFIISGYVRLFHYNDKGEETTIHINCSPGFITSYFNFINATKSNDNLECITECKLLRITKSNLDLFTQQSAAFRNFSILVFQQSIMYNEKRSQ